LPPDGLETLLSPYVGIVRGIHDVLAGPEDVRLVTSWCESAHPRELVGAQLAHTGSGSGRTAREARAAALGEAVERYSASFADPEALVVASARELGSHAVEPSRFALFSESQYRTACFPYARFDRDTRLAWIEGVSLPNGEPAWLPAQLVHLAGHDDEQPICRTTSSGLACHRTAAEATFAALLELLERDAFMITWKARISWPVLEWSGNEQLASFERSFLRPTGLRWRAIDLSAFWNVPVVVAVVRSDAPGTAPLGVGAGADATVERAVRKALDEGARVRTWAQALWSVGREAPTAGDVRDFDDHIRFYAEPSNARRVDFLDGSSRRRHVDSVATLEGSTAEEHIEAVCRRLAQRGVSAYAVDVTAPDVREAGLAVVRVVAPELCALDVEHGARLLGGRRLYDEPRRLGVRKQPLTEAEVNPDPHPFP
jgi:ribosomal protein S12 methylthiotransferase accessory factor